MQATSSSGEIKKDIGYLDPALPRLSWRIHPTSSVATFIKRGWRVTYKIHGKTIRGVTKVLKTAFYPMYHYDLAIYQDQPSSSSSSSSSYPMYPTTPKKLQQQGINRGKTLDKNLGIILNAMQSMNLPQSMFSKVPPSGAVKWTLKEAKAITESMFPSVDNQHITMMAKTFNKIMNAKQTHALRLIQYFNQQDLRLRAVQVICGMEGVAATQIDGIVMNNKNQLIPFEIKSGMSTYMHKYTATLMNAPFQDQNDSPLHQAFLQLCVGTHFYCQTYPQHQSYITTPLLIQVTKDQIFSYPLPSWCSSRIEQAIIVLAASSS